MPDISIIIPHRGIPLGFWATVTSCENDLIDSGISPEYIFVTNGAEEVGPEIKNTIYHIEKNGRLGSHTHFKEGMSPPDARQFGANQAKGKYLFFLDNHCIITKDYFKRSLYDFENYDIDMLHSTTQYYVDDVKCYNYRFKLEYNFWGESVSLPRYPMKPFRVGVGGHGGFMVKNDSWIDTGGYGPKGIFDGYGGEEFYTDLKFWLYGKSVWMDPLILHYHYAGDRGYKRHYYDNYYINMMVSANLIGGEKWLNKVFESFCDPSKHLRFTSGANPPEMYELYMIAQQRSQAHALEVHNRAGRTLDDLLVWFRQNEIATD